MSKPEDDLRTAFDTAVEGMVNAQSRAYELEQELDKVMDMIIANSRYEVLREWAYNRRGAAK